jgi:hypothetical protein
MFDFDHIEAWGPRLCRELSVAVPGDVSQAITSGKPQLVEDARDILLSKVDQTVVLRLVVNWLKLQIIVAYHGSRLTAEEIARAQQPGKTHTISWHSRVRVPGGRGRRCFPPRTSMTAEVPAELAAYVALMPSRRPRNSRNRQRPR